MNVLLRNTTEDDIAGLEEVLDSSGLFPSECLNEMMSEYLNNPESEEIWFTCLLEDKPVGFGYCAPEKFTQGTYNLLAIAVRKDMQGKGLGRSMMGYIERLLKEKSNRLLIVETSSDSQYGLTREFYEKLNYVQEATIRDFWKGGEDKIIYLKKLHE
jgi:ribosomal protein S18 acetylase RimI-like enzyme